MNLTSLLLRFGASSSESDSGMGLQLRFGQWRKITNEDDTAFPMHAILGHQRYLGARADLKAGVGKGKTRLTESKGVHLKTGQNLPHSGGTLRTGTLGPGHLVKLLESVQGLL